MTRGLAASKPVSRGSRQLKERRAALVLVAVEKRGQGSGRVRMRVIPDFKARTIIPFLTQNVAPGSTIYTDGLKSFAGLAEAGFKHVRSHPTAPIRTAQRCEVGCPTCRSGHWQPPAVADRHLPRSEQAPNSRFTSTNSSFGTIAARHPRPHFRPSLASEPAANQPSTSRSGEQETSTPTYWGLLKSTG